MLSTEELLGPPKVPFLSVIMMTIGATIAGFISGAMIFILIYFFLGKFSLDSGASPILLSMITFFSLAVGSTVVYFIASLVIPDMYTRSKTAMSQLVIFSIILYILFAPIYLLVSNSTTHISILSVFSLHIMFGTFGLYIVMNLVSQYRYVLISVYGSLIAFLIVGIVWVLYIFPMDPSSQALFILIGLVMLSFIGTTFIIYTLLWAYYALYKSTWLDPVGNIFTQIEREEKDIEGRATDILTKF